MGATSLNNPTEMLNNSTKPTILPLATEPATINDGLVAGTQVSLVTRSEGNSLVDSALPPIQQIESNLQQPDSDPNMDSSNRSKGRFNEFKGITADMQNKVPKRHKIAEEIGRRAQQLVDPK